MSRLPIRLNDGVNDRHVTDHATGFSFKKVANGGHHSASVTLTLPRRAFPNLGPESRLYAYDPRTGRTLFEGYTENPGDTDGDDGQGFELSALGGMSRVSDERRALVYIDRDLSLWNRDGLTSIPASATTDAGPDPDGLLATDGLVMQFANGNPVGSGSGAQMGYSLGGTDMQFGAIHAEFKSGKTDTGYLNQVAWSGTGGSGSSTIGSSAGITAGPSLSSADRWVGETGHPPAGVTRVALNIVRTGGATNVADDNTWSWFTNVSVLGRRMTRYAALLTGLAGMQTTQYVLATWVVEDLLGRLLTFCDPVTAQVDATSTQIDQLSYRDAVAAAQVLDDLTLYEPDYLWEVLETGANGLHRFNYRAWPTTARYEISTSDGYSAPGGDEQLCNRVAVDWTDAKGRPQTTIRTSAVPRLDALGIVRDADKITLPEGRGSLANAQRVGDQVLLSLSGTAQAATATVRRPLMDLQRCRLVEPWEIEPGYLVRVRETGDLLRLTEMQYVDDDAAASLTLGTPVLSVEQRVARLARVV